MTSSETVEIFFSRTFENDLNEKILDDKNYVVPLDRVLRYVNIVLSVSYDEYLYYLIDINFPNIRQKDITQCSSFSSCEIDMCNILLSEDNPGFTFEDIGRLFPDKCKSDKTTALRKYGENQIKTSKQLGLAYEYYGLWYLDVLGYVYPLLSESDRNSLLARTILRDPFYGHLIQDLLTKDIDISDYMDGLSQSTMIRRERGIKQILHFAIGEAKKIGVELTVKEFEKPVRSLSTTKDITNVQPAYLFTKKIDKSFINRGLTIPKRAINNVLKVICQDVPIGEFVDVSIEFNGLEYGARLNHISFTSSHSDCYQMFWKGKPSISEALKLFYAESSPYISYELLKASIVEIWGIIGTRRFIIISSTTDSLFN